MDGLVGLPDLDLIALGHFADGEGRAVAQLFLGVLAIKMERSMFAFIDVMGFYDILSDVARLLLLFLQEIFEHLQHSLQYNIQERFRMDQQSVQQFCKLPLGSLFELAYDCQIRVVGAINEIFQHKKYIIELFISKKLMIRCMKRYSEFEALYEVIRMNFKNIDLNLSEFPSKFQLISREETRRNYFQKLLNKILEIYCEKITNETNRRLLSTIYVFMAGQQAKQPRSFLISEKSSLDEESMTTSKKLSMKTEEMKGSKSRRQFETEFRKASHRKAEQIMVSSSSVKMGMTTEDEAKFRAFISTEFLIKFQDEVQWKQRFLKIENSCLLIYKHKNDNNFKTKIELYQSKIDYSHRQKNVLDHFCEKMEFDNEPTYLQDFTTLAISHEFDYKKLMIKVREDQQLELPLVKELLIKASHQTSNCQNIEGVFSPIGKMFIILHKIFFECSNKKVSPIVYLRINASGLTYETKRMNFTNNVPVNIKQGFLIPISNAFANILVQVIINENDGIISHGTQQKCIGTYRLCFSDFISYTSGYGLEKIHARPQIDPHLMQKYQSLLELSVMNYSHFSSIYADAYANQNDGILMTGLKSTQDTELLVITVDRVLRVIGNVALFITAFWRNVYLFKYPRMGYAFFIILPFFIMFAHAGMLFQILISFLIMAMLYNIPRCNALISELMEIYIFNHKHEDHKQPLCIDTNELKFIKWTQNLIKMREDYDMHIKGKLQKKQVAKNKKFQYWEFKIHEKTFKIKQELPGLIEKVFEVKKIIELVLRMINVVVNTVEKICNIFSWADPRRSIVIFGILIFISNVSNQYLFRGIGFIFCMHRLWKGKTFYKLKHYHNNRRLAIYCLRYIINKSFVYLLPNKEKKIETIDQNQITEVLGEIFFPVREDDKVKKLKEEIQFILGVFIEPEEFYKREERKNQMRLYYLIEIIESCEARLKLEWISGVEGISENFQELKGLTTEELVIDLWVESLLINFFWNIPSQLYTTFRPIRTSASLRCEKAKDKIGDCFVKLSV